MLPKKNFSWHPTFEVFSISGTYSWPLKHPADLWIGLASKFCINLSTPGQHIPSRWKKWVNMSLCLSMQSTEQAIQR